MAVEEELENQIHRLFDFFDKPKQNKISAMKLGKGLARVKEKMSA